MGCRGKGGSASEFPIVLPGVLTKANSPLEAELAAGRVIRLSLICWPVGALLGRVEMEKDGLRAKSCN